MEMSVSKSTFLAEDSTQTNDQDDHIYYMKQTEVKNLPDIRSIEIQSEDHWLKRCYLLDFLLDVHDVSQLHPETLHLAVNLLDRYCSYRIDIDYELLGCVTLLIAAKYRDDRESAQKLGWMCCSLREGSVLTKMEWNVLQELDWEVGHPTVVDFQQFNLIASAKSLRHPLLEYLSLYLAEIALYHREFISIRPSTMSSCILALAHDILKCERPSDREWIAPVCEPVVYNLSICLARPPTVAFNKYVRSRSPCLGAAIEMYLRGRLMLLLQATAEFPTQGINTAHSVTHDSGVSYR